MEGGIEKFRKLKVWEKAHLLVLQVYKVTEDYPRHEQYGLTSQMRRATVSIVANIVEGTKRNTNKDKRHFFTMSDTSLEEAKYFFILSLHLKYINEDAAKDLTKRAREVGRMLNGLIKSLKS